MLSAADVYCPLLCPDSTISLILSHSFIFCGGWSESNLGREELVLLEQLVTIPVSSDSISPYHLITDSFS